MTNLQLAQDALSELRLSSGYLNAKAQNSPAAFAGTHVGKCEADLVQLVANLSPVVTPVPPFNPAKTSLDELASAVSKLVANLRATGLPV